MIDIFDFARTEGRAEVLNSMYRSLQKKLQNSTLTHDQAIAQILEWHHDEVITQAEVDDFTSRIG